MLNITPFNVQTQIVLYIPLLTHQHHVDIMLQEARGGAFSPGHNVLLCYASIATVAAEKVVFVSEPDEFNLYMCLIRQNTLCVIVTALA